MTQLALVIDLNVCVGCHACVTSCKQWNTSGAAGPLFDLDPYGADPSGWVWGKTWRSNFPHPLAEVPLIGGRFKIPSVPISGSGQTPN